LWHGQPVAGNPTQYVMEKAFATAGLDFRYLTLEVAPDDLAGAIGGLKAMGFRGGNLAYPHKVAGIEFVDRLGESAELVGAINCIYRQDDQLVGENTEGRGLLKSVQEIIDPREQKVVILGSGSMARAAAVELGRAGAAEITIVSRSPERGQALVELLQDRLDTLALLAPWEGDYQLAEGTNLLVQATSLGDADAKARIPLDLDRIDAEMVVADVVLHPPETRLLRDAAERGCRTRDGLSVFVHQAFVTFAFWTEVEPNQSVMREALEEFLMV
jgi:shikimate dehydrogenase